MLLIAAGLLALAGFACAGGSGIAFEMEKRYRERVYGWVDGACYVAGVVLIAGALALAYAAGRSC